MIICDNPNLRLSWAHAFKNHPPAISTVVVLQVDLSSTPKLQKKHTPCPDAKEAQLRFRVWPKGVDASDLQKHR